MVHGHLQASGLISRLSLNIHAACFALCPVVKAKNETDEPKVRDWFFLGEKSELQAQGHPDRTLKLWQQTVLSGDHFCLLLLLLRKDVSDAQVGLRGTFHTESDPQMWLAAIQ